MNKEYLKKVICCAVDEMEISELCNEEAVLMEIRQVLLAYNNNDFECVEKILEILEKNGYDCGNCHDF